MVSRTTKVVAFCPRNKRKLAMPQEEQSDWPSFETVLREVAPTSPSIRDRPGKDKPADPTPAPAPAPEDNDDGEIIGADDGNVSDAADLPELSDPLDLDTSSIRELLKQRTSPSSFESSPELAALEPLPEVLDLDNPAPGDLIDDDRSLADGYRLEARSEPEPPEPTETDIESAPPPPILSTPPPPAPQPEAELTLEPVEAPPPPEPLETPAEEASSFSFEQSEDVDLPDLSEPLNPFDPTFEGIAEEVVEDEGDGWVTHSLHDIGIIDPPTGESAPAPDQQTAAPSPATTTSAEAPFDPLARMTSSSPFDQGESPEAPPAEPTQGPFSGLIPEEAAPTFDASGLFETGISDSSSATAELQPVEPTQTSAAPLDLSGWDGGIVFEELPEPPAPADQLIDFESYRPTDSAAGNAPLEAWTQQQDADVLPFVSPHESTPPAGQPERPSTEDLFHIDDDTERGGVQPDAPRPNWVGLDADLSAPPPPLATPAAPARDASNDPWAEMRPNEVPEKISFWENRPKFFGGDERRKARARREAKQLLEQSGNPLPTPRSCPNCGGPCRIDIEDPSTGRTHVSCNVCLHMWVEDTQTR